MDENIAKFTIKNNEGENTVCDVLFTFDSDETKKSYIVFTDNSVDEAGNIKVYANTYNPDEEVNEDGLTLGDIETEKEWKIIDNLLSSLQEKIEESNEVKTEEE